MAILRSLLGTKDINVSGIYSGFLDDFEILSKSFPWANLNLASCVAFFAYEARVDLESSSICSTSSFLTASTLP